MTEAQPSKFGALLRQHRLAAGLTQEALAARAGISAKAVGGLERGLGRTPRLNTVTLLAAALSMDGAGRAALLEAARPAPLPPPLRAPPEQFRHDLPRPLTPLFGRVGVLESVVELLRRGDVRLLTLTGPSGVGKTRLAIAAADRLGDAFADGVIFVELASLPAPNLVLPAIARRLGLDERRAGPLSERITAGLYHRHLLLVLDNFEHLLPAREEVVDVLEACPHLALLVTSRFSLRVRGEREYRVAPLELPADGDDTAPAVVLFRDRALACGAVVPPGKGSTPMVAAICRRLDGLPLAIELAAAWTRVLPLETLRDRLEERLPLLVQGPYDLPARQQTMRDAIAWSYDLLDSAAQRLFRSLSVFVGGWSLSAAAAVVGGDEVIDLLPALAALADRSLVHPASGGAGDACEPRFAMLETIREFGLERLNLSGEAEHTRHAHFRFCLDLAERTALSGRGDRRSVVQLEAEHANLRAALAWSIDAAPARALQLATRMERFWLTGAHHGEGRGWLERALDGASPEESALRGEALLVLGELRRHFGDTGGARDAFEEAGILAQVAGQRHRELAAARGLSALAVDAAAPDAAALSESVATMARALGDRRSLAEGLHNLGWAAAHRGHITEALAFFEEAREHARGVGDLPGLAHIFNSIGNLHAEQGNFEQALTLLEECLTLARKLHDQRQVAETLVDLGWLALELGDMACARARFADVLPFVRLVERQRDMIFALEGCAVLGARDGQWETAIRLVGATKVLRHAMDLPIPDDPRVMAFGDLSARATLRQLASATRWGDVNTWSMETALAEAETIVASTSGPVRAPNPLETLSARERDVFALLVQGRTDRQIAESLFITRRTASKHVSAILAKLGATNRTEAIATNHRDHVDR